MARCSYAESTASGQNGADAVGQLAITLASCALEPSCLRVPPSPSSPSPPSRAARWPRATASGAPAARAWAARARARATAAARVAASSSWARTAAPSRSAPASSARRRRTTARARASRRRPSPAPSTIRRARCRSTTSTSTSPTPSPTPSLTGNPKCTQCEAPASGNPVIGALTDASGKFTLSYASAPTRGACPAATTSRSSSRSASGAASSPSPPSPPAPPTPSPTRRRPPTSSASPPRAARATCRSSPSPAGAIRPSASSARSASTTPSSSRRAAPTGHVHFYTGQDAGQLQRHATPPWSPAATPRPTPTSGGPSSANLLKYDIVFNACECNPNDRGADAYPAMHDYLNGGGRLFTTHYYYNWFAPPTGHAGPAGRRRLGPARGAPDPPYNNFYIDTELPQGHGLRAVAAGTGRDHDARADQPRRHALGHERHHLRVVPLDLQRQHHVRPATRRCT